MALDAFLIITPGTSGSVGVQLTGAPSPDAQNLDGIAVDVSTVEFAAERPTTIGVTTGGAGAGKLRNRPCKVTKAVDNLSPSFLMLAGQAVVLPRMELYLRHEPVSGSGPAAASLAYTFQRVEGVS